MDEVAGAGAAPWGSITLVRHGEPALSRRIRLSASGYRDWWALYEDGGLKSGQAPPCALVEAAARADALICSTRRRAIESARAIAANRPCHTDSIYVEAPLPPPALPEWVRLPPRWWGLVSRIWWWLFAHEDGQETYAQAVDRAALAARSLASRAAQGEEVLLIAHGFFNLMIGRALKSGGWRLTLNQGFRYWSARRFEPDPVRMTKAQTPLRRP